MRPPYFIYIYEILQEMESFVVEDTDVGEVINERISASIINFGEVIEAERILTRRLLQEYTNFIKRNNLDRYNPTNDVTKLEEVQVNSLRILRDRVRKQLRSRILNLHNMYILLRFLGRGTPEQGITKGEGSVKIFLDELKDMFDLVIDDHTVVLFDIRDRFALRSYFIFAVESLERNNLEKQYDKKMNDLESVKFFQTIAEDYFTINYTFIEFVDFFMPVIFGLSVNILEKNIENMDEIEKMHVTEILIKQGKIAEQFYIQRFLGRKILFYLHNRQHRETSMSLKLREDSLKKLEELQKDYMGPQIKYINSAYIKESKESIEFQRSNLEFLEYAMDLHEKMLAKQPLDKELAKFTRFTNDLQSTHRGVFSTTMLLPTLKPLLLQNMANETKVKVIEKFLESYTEMIMENLLHKVKEYIRIFFSREDFSDGDIEDKVRLQLFLKDIQEIRIAYAAVPPFIRSHVGLVLFLEFFEKVLLVDLNYIDRLVPNLKNSYFSHLIYNAHAISILSSIEGHPKKILKNFSDSKSMYSGISDAVKQLEQIYDQIRGFILTVSASVELSLHWNIVEYEFVNRGANDLITLLNTWEMNDTNLGIQKSVLSKLDTVIEITEYILSDTFLKTFPAKYLSSFHSDMTENLTFFKLVSVAYHAVRELILGYNKARQGVPVIDLIDRISSIILSLNVEGKKMSKPQLAPLGKLITEVSEYSNHIQYSISELDVMEQPIRQLVSKLLDSVLSPIPH